MISKIITSLSSLGFKVRESFSLTPFSLISAAPTVTVGIKSENVVKEVFDDGEKDVFEREVTVNVYSPKRLGATYARECADKVLFNLKDYYLSAEISKTDYNPTLRHFFTAITLTLPKTEE